MRICQLPVLFLPVVSPVILLIDGLVPLIWLEDNCTKKEVFFYLQGLNQQ